MTDYPYSKDAEESFLGSVLTSEGAILDEFIVTPEHFYTPQNRIIAATCLALHNARAPVNPMSVTAELRQAGSLDQAGGASGISSLFGPHSMAEHYHTALCEKLSLRRAVDAARWAEKAWINTETAEGYLEEFRARISTISVSGAEQNEVPIAAKAMEARLEKIARGEKVTGIKTGNTVWNNAFGGLVPGAYYALAGRPGTGKSAMMEEMIGDMIADGLPVLVFQRDMSPQKMVERICCRWCGVPFWRYVRGMLMEKEITALRETVSSIIDTPLYIYNPIGLTAEKLCSIMRREVRMKGIRAVFLDHIQALKTGKDLREGLTQASLTIRGAVTELNIPFVTLCHLNRDGGKGERPSANNIKEFDQLFGDVDGMAILWNEPMKDDHDPTAKKVVNFYVAKNRDGAEAESQILFDGAMLKFLGKVQDTAA